MNWWDSAISWAKSAWSGIHGFVTGAPSALEGLWHYITTLASAIQWMMSHPVTAVVNALAAFAGLVTGNLHDAMLSARRAIGWYDQNRLNPFMQWTRKQFRLVYATIRSDVKSLLVVMAQDYVKLQAYTRTLVNRERRRRIAGDKRSEAYTRHQVKWALGLVQREAASAYRRSAKDRMSLISRLADLIVGRNPLVSGLLKRIITILLDVAEIDNPVLRITAGFLIKHLISALGLDRAMGALLRDLAGPLADHAAPVNLHQVIADLSGRLNAIEAWQVTFMADGGPEILQAGEQWRDLTGLATDVALLAFLADAVASPQHWAHDMATVAGPAVHEATRAVAAVLR